MGRKVFNKDFMKTSALRLLGAVITVLVVLFLMDVPGELFSAEAGEGHSCGAIHSLENDHTTDVEESWNEWTSDNSLPGEAGYYYLCSCIEEEHLREAVQIKGAQ